MTLPHIISLHFLTTMKFKLFSHGNSSLPHFAAPKTSPKPQPHNLQLPKTHLSYFCLPQHCLQETVSLQNYFPWCNCPNYSNPTCTVLRWIFFPFKAGSFRDCQHQILVPVLWRWVCHPCTSSIWGHHGARGIESSTWNVFFLKYSVASLVLKFWVLIKSILKCGCVFRLRR